MSCDIPFQEYIFQKSFAFWNILKVIFCKYFSYVDEINITFKQYNAVQRFYRTHDVYVLYMLQETEFALLYTI